ncbi:vacuolar transporter chaperone [Martiniozyma asiatica (nom. inval.)]|nr:vacuolar transporter chaperone [Martiniozyma asiatica]
MLFGVKLQNEIYPPWKKYYIDYDGLKRLLKENVLSNSQWNEKDEALFAELLDSELEKVYSFQVSKYKELDSEITKLEIESESYLESVEQQKPSDAAFDAKTFQSKLEKLLTLTNELDHFARINFTGFIKIVKKHDRLHKGYSVKALLNVRMKDLPLNNISEDTSPYLFRISTLYAFIREQLQASSLSTSLKETFSKLSTSGKLSSTPNTNMTSSISKDSTYKVLKFWIHPDNLMEIKTTILRHLPVLIYNNGGNDNDDDDDDEFSSDPTITYLYFDNRNFELYNNKLLKQLNKTPSLRINWTGKLKNNPELTIEKKTFDYDSGESNDIKLQLKEKYINDFIFGNKKNESNESIAGAAFGNDDDDDDNDAEDHHLRSFKSSKPKKQFTLDTFVKRLRKRGFPQQTIDKYTNEFNQLQSFITKEDLQPALRTVFTRTAFQIPGDDRIRITIDSDVLFIREDSFDIQRPIRNPDEWHRKDIDSNINNPYSLLRKGEFSKFPYSVMEVKIASSIFNNPSSKTLAWVNDMINSHLVKEVPNFSKFIQGISSLFLEDDNLDILPFWLPELEVDIRRNPEQAYKDSKNKKLLEQKQTEVLKNLKKKIGKTIEPSVASKQNDLTVIEEDDDLDIESSDEEDSYPPSPEQLSLLKAQNTLTPAAIESPGAISLPMKAIAERRQRKTNLGELLMPVFVGSSKLDGYESEDEEIELPPGVVKPTQLIRQSGPVKVEAKVWLANERTFVRWLHVTTLLTALTFTIYNSVNSSHFPNLATDLAYIYFALTLFSGVWAYGIYHKRLELIKARSGQHLDGMLGPLVLALVLIITLCLEFYAGLKKWQEKRSMMILSLGEHDQALNPAIEWTLEKLFSLV